jgi:hypothetical protein
MDKVIVTVLLIIAGITCSIVVLNAVYPAITNSSGAITDAASNINDKIRSDIKIIEIGNQNGEVYVWIKNVGSSRISSINSCDVFFGLQGKFARIPFGSGGSSPYWTYSYESGDAWGPTATIKITVYPQATLSGTYIFKFVIPNGIYDEDMFSAI